MNDRLSSRRKDVFVLTADTDAATAVKALLSRHESLKIRPINWEVDKHPRHDSGCARDGVEYLRGARSYSTHALMIFDHHGSGLEESPLDIEVRLEHELERSGWGAGRTAVIVIEPELEAWVWGRVGWIERSLDWPKASPGQSIQEFSHSLGLWPESRIKPDDPKKVLHRVHYKTRKKSSVPPRFFGEMAAHVSLSTCNDRAFCKLCAVLKQWFGNDSAVKES